MAVFIHGIEYVPKPDTFLLTESHFIAAAKLADPFAAIEWAFDTQSTVSQMESWSRQNCTGQESTPEPVQKKKPPRQLFGD